MIRSLKLNLQLFTFFFLGIFLSTTGVYAQQEVYDWQVERYPGTKESFKEDIDKQLRSRPEFSEQEEVYNWQLDEYENTEESFKEDIQKQLRPKPEFTSGEETYNWQLEEYPRTQEIESSLPEHY